MNITEDIFDTCPPRDMGLSFAWEEFVGTEGQEQLGDGPFGKRTHSNFTTGFFRGGPGMPEFHGIILPGGASRQHFRPDGIRRVEATYDLKVDDGTVIGISQRTLFDDSFEGGRYIAATVDVSAPSGRWEGLNRRLFMGTLHPVKATAGGVIARVYQLDVAPFIPAG